MFGPELHNQNDQLSITLAPIAYNDLPHMVDDGIKAHLTDAFSDFLTSLPSQYEWLDGGTDNMHWGIYDRREARLLGITGVRNLGVAGEPAISRIALFADDMRGRGLGRLAYATQYEFARQTLLAAQYEHSADNANTASLKIAKHVGFIAIRDDGRRTTMRLHHKR